MPIPFTREEWGGIRMTDLPDHAKFMEFHSACVDDIHKSGRVSGYVKMFTMVTHIGRFPEFDKRSYGRFLKEAEGQPLTATRLERALDVVLAVSGPEEALPSAVSAFEFATIVSDFAGYVVEQQFKGHKRLEELVEHIGAFAMMAFIVAVNVEFGLADRKSWSLKGGS
ncbi:MAG: hypothetical protein QM783_08830 [Phycisphaerales bacterium]